MEKVIEKTYSDGDKLVATLDSNGEVRIYTVSAKPDLRFTSADGWQYQESMTEKEFEVWRKQYGI